MIITGGVKVSASQDPAGHRVGSAALKPALVAGVAHESGASKSAPRQRRRRPGIRREAVRAALGAAAVPRRILQLPALPLLPNGKFDRMALGALLAATTASRPPGNASTRRRSRRISPCIS